MNIEKLNEISNLSIALDALGLALEKFSTEDKDDYEQITRSFSKMIREYSVKILDAADEIEMGDLKEIIRFDKSSVCRGMNQLGCLNGSLKKELAGELLNEIESAERVLAEASGFLSVVRNELKGKVKPLDRAAA